MDILDAKDDTPEITDTEKAKCPFCCVSFDSAWDALCHVCSSAAIPPQQQWIPSTKDVSFKGHSLDSDGIGKSVLDEVIISMRVCLNVSKARRGHVK